VAILGISNLRLRLGSDDPDSRKNVASSASEREAGRSNGAPTNFYRRGTTCAAFGGVRSALSTFALTVELLHHG
jgi:hypothetical protein